MAARWPTHGREIHGANATLIAVTGYDLWAVTSGRKADLRNVIIKGYSGNVNADIYDCKSGGAGLSGVELSGFLKLRAHAQEHYSGKGYSEGMYSDSQLLGMTFLSSIHVIATVSGSWIHVGFEEY